MYGAPETSLRAFAPTTRVVGRDEEIALLRRTAQAVLDEGQARIVTLVGPNGVGKTTIIDQALRDLTLTDAVAGKEDANARRFRVYRGSAVETSLGQAALVTLLRSRFGLGEGSSTEALQAQIHAHVSKVLDDRKVGDVCFFLGQILDVPFPPSPLTKALGDDPQQMRLIRRSILKNFFETDAARSPLCLVFRLDVGQEDSVALVSYLIEHLSGPLLIVCSVRPELSARHPGWFGLGGARHTRIDVGPLANDVAADLMRELLAPCEGGPPDALVDAGVRLAGGNVGLLHAIVQIFHAAGVLEELDSPRGEPRFRVHEDKLDSASLPVTVEDTVSMRVAALSTREVSVLEHAAAMGNVFWVGALVALDRETRKTPLFWEIGSDSEIDSVEAVLGSLEQRDYVKRHASSSFVGEAQYSFQHKLERQRLRSLTTPEALQRHHQIVADWLEHRQPEHPTREHMVLLAYHLDHAGSKIQAGLLYLDAADAARANFAVRNAEEQYARGLVLLGSTETRRRIDAYHHHGDVLSMLGRTDDALLAFREMLALAYRLDVRAKGGAAHNRIGRLYRAMGALDEARRHLETALLLFESVADERGVAACHDDVGILLWTRGDYEPALERLRTALEMRKNVGDKRSIALSLHNLGIVFRDHGRAAEAEESLEAALAMRREIDDPIGVGQALESLGRLAQDQNDLVKAQRMFQEAYDVAREVAERNWLAVVLTHLAEIQFRVGGTEKGGELLREAESLCDEQGARLHLAEAKRGLAASYLIQGDLKKARSAIKFAVDLFGQIRSKSHLARALRTLGEVTGAGAWGPAHEGKTIDYFMRSIALCKEIGNEIEIAKSYRSFSDYVAVSEHYKKNEQIQNEAKKLRAMSDDIFKKQRSTPERSVRRPNARA
jgi:tetratricopeptide (TPR) repeat protein